MTALGFDIVVNGRKVQQNYEALSYFFGLAKIIIYVIKVVYLYHLQKIYFKS